MPVLNKQQLNNQGFLSYNILCICLLSVLYIIIKFATPYAINTLYSNNHIEFLNNLCHQSEHLSMTYYQGMIDERYAGPATSILAVIILTMFCFSFGSKISGGRLLIVFFLYLIVTKFDVLFFPPWGDHAGGSVAEAVWLARHHHDYAGLFFGPSSIHGGPKFFFFSFYPGLLAVLMRILPNTTLFLITAHLINFALAAWITYLFYKLMQPLTNDLTAKLASILLITLPLYQSMTEMINMEIPTLFFVMISAYFLSQKKITMSVLMAILAVGFKGSGAIACGAVFIGIWILYFCDVRIRFNWKILIGGFIALIFAFLQVYLRKRYVHDIDEGHNTVSLLSGLSAITHSTYFFKLYIFGLFGMLIFFIRNFIQNKFSFRRSFSFINDNFIIITVFLFATAWIALHMNVAVMGPRYKLNLTPFLLYLVLFSLIKFIPSIKFINSLLIFSILVAAASSYGLLYPERVESRYYAYGQLERSLEYRNDLKLHQLLVKELNDHFPGFTVGAPWITAHYLALNELGYTKKPFPVVLYGQDITFGGMRNYKGLRNIEILKTIWIGFKSNFPPQFEYPIDSRDKIIKKIYYGDKYATLFMGGIGIERLFLVNEMHRRRAIIHE